MKKIFIITLFLSIMIAPAFTHAETSEFITSNLYQGLKSAEVKILQQKLQDLGYLPSNLKLTTYFGSLTKKAVKDYQKAKGLPATGYVGTLTREKLSEISKENKDNKVQSNTPKNSSIFETKTPAISISSPVNATENVVLVKEKVSRWGGENRISCLQENCVAISGRDILFSGDLGKKWVIAYSTNLSSEKVSDPAQVHLSNITCVTSLCIATDSEAGIFRSTDNGRTWTFQKNMLNDSITEFYPAYISALSCVNDKICYVAGASYYAGGSISGYSNPNLIGDVLLKTVDGGQSWQAIKTSKYNFAEERYINMAPTAQSNVVKGVYSELDKFPVGAIRKMLCKTEMECYAVGNSRTLFYTNNGWKTMTLTQFKMDGVGDIHASDYVKAIWPTSDNSKIARCGFDGLNYSNDGGIIIDALALNYFCGKMILKSLDSGVTWKNVEVSLPSYFTNGFVNCFKDKCNIVSSYSDHDKDYSLGMTTNSVGISTSMDNGNTWGTNTLLFQSKPELYSAQDLSCVNLNNCIGIGRYAIWGGRGEDEGYGAGGGGYVVFKPR